MKESPSHLISAFAIALVLAGCTSSPSATPRSTATASAAPTGTASANPTVSASPSAAPSLDVSPLIPDLAAGGTLDLLGEDGATSATFPGSTSLQLFSPFGNGFLTARQSNGEVTALVALQPDGRLVTLQTLTTPATFVDATGALDGHAWAWLQGNRNSSFCNGGLGSGTLNVGSPGMQPRVVAQLPSGGADAAWQLGGWVGDNIWLVQIIGCTQGGGATTNAYIARESGGGLTPVQSQLGAGCAVTSVALDGSMLCTTQPAKLSDTTWRFVGAGGTVQNFSAASLSSLCAGHGVLADFEGFTLSLDAAYMAVDAGCFSSSRFDQLFIIATGTATARRVDTSTYLAADSWLPDDRLLCNDLSNPSRAQSYLVTTQGNVSHFSAGNATWHGGGVTW